MKTRYTNNYKQMMCMQGFLQANALLSKLSKKPV